MTAGEPYAFEGYVECGLAHRPNMPPLWFLCHRRKVVESELLKVNLSAGIIDVDDH